MGVRQMRAKLPKHAYEKLVSAIRHGKKLDLDIAPTVAQAIKDSPEFLRDWKNDGKPLWWKVYGRNKKSICLDLKDAEDKARLMARVRRIAGQMAAIEKAIDQDADCAAVLQQVAGGLRAVRVR